MSARALPCPGPGSKALAPKHLRLVFTASPYGDADGATTWPLDEAHQSCEQPLTLDYVRLNIEAVAAYYDDFAGWYEREYQAYDYEFKSGRERLRAHGGRDGALLGHGRRRAGRCGR